MKLRQIAHARAGDKGDTANISVIAYNVVDFAHLERHLSADGVKNYFSNPAIREVRRYELPALSALNFVLEGALSGGVTQSLAMDAHGKCLSSVLLDLEIPDLV